MFSFVCSSSVTIYYGNVGKNSKITKKANTINTFFFHSENNNEKTAFYPSIILI